MFLVSQISQATHLVKLTLTRQFQIYSQGKFAGLKKSVRCKQVATI